MEERIPRYIKIAQDICGRILTGEFAEGSILKGRSMLASLYNVSPETIRKALTVLAQEKVIDVRHGVGVYIDSVLHAKQFAERWQAKTAIKSHYQKVLTIMDERAKLDANLLESIKDLTDTFKFQTRESVAFSEVEIPADSWVNGKTIGEVYFWNYTEATIVAVVDQHDGTAQASPGPDFPLKGGDKLLIVGKDDLSFERVLSFLIYGVVEEETAEEQN